MGIGFWELFLILLVACLVIKPHQLPELMGMVGAWLRQLKGITAQIKREWQQQASQLEKGQYLTSDDDGAFDDNEDDRQ